MKYAVRVKILLAGTIFALLTVSVAYLIYNPGFIRAAPSAAKPMSGLTRLKW